MLRTTTLSILLLFTFAQSISAWGQQDTVKVSSTKPWYEKISIRGYAQVRYNRLLETNSDLKCEQCDKSWGESGGIFLRRARIIFFGQISPRVYFYFQPDFASAAGANLHYAQIRDVYFDLGLTADNTLRIRLGQSKVPFGFENMQSSQNRLPLDRADPLNSALPNERDLGAFVYWAPKNKRALFSKLVRDGLKGSGDYGVLAFGVFNGQAANKADQNNSLHAVARASMPIEIGNQIIEPGIQAYTGRYVITTDQLSSGTKYVADRNYLDQRAAASLVLYPKPIGVNAEYNIGMGPEYNPATDSIETQPLKGGYVMISASTKIGKHNVLPFIRYQYYDGGKKLERDARSYTVYETEYGVEWQPVRAFELVVMYTVSDRRFEDHSKPINRQQGSLIRIQAQINF